MDKGKKPESYESALNKAWESLKSLDPKKLAKNSGASYNQDKNEFTLFFMNDDHRINHLKKTVLGPDGNEVKPFLAVLLLHYLVYARDFDLDNKLITFRELVGGDVYYDAFVRRAIDPIKKFFGSNKEALRTAGKNIGAIEGDYGDISLIIDVFPRISVTVILWEGDEEIPPSSNMLFDASIKKHLPTEDVAVIGGFVASALIKSLKNP